MSVSLMRETNTITVANFWENHILKKYNFHPAYQRKSVWSEEKQSFFIDSLLKNFPIPPIFLHQKIDDSTGKTQYDVIDGKQRLTSIIRFLNNEIPASDETEKSPFHDEKVAGVYFKDLDEKGLTDYKKRFWRYAIPIEYIDTDKKEIIDNIFDRLNRNGEPLKGQELRRSKYHGTELLNLVERVSKQKFWEMRLTVTDAKRMEHYEFISEIIFQQVEDKCLKADQEILDSLYETYSKKAVEWAAVEERFTAITDVMESLGIDYDKFRVGGVSHLYGIWCLANHCEKNGVNPNTIKGKLFSFYSQLRLCSADDAYVKKYSQSMASRTRDRGQRERRFHALKDYLGLK